MIRDILVNLAQGVEKDRACEYAASLAAAFGAQLTGLSVAYEIDVPPFYMGALPTDFIDAQMQENQAAAEQAIQRFRATATAAGVPFETRSLSASLGVAANSFARLARLYDLTVVAQPNPDQPGPEEVIAETVLMESGRAVLIVPYVQTKPFATDRVVVAWDGGRSCARALAEALPLLHRARHVEVFRALHEHGDAADDEGPQVARHLARHGLETELRRLPVLASGDSVGDAILNEVADQGADLVVMGGYGHSRLRELVLGGVTRDILATMTVPVLMAH